MIIKTNQENAFTEKWFKQCFLPENIPDNSLFLSYFFKDKDELPNLHYYLKFNGSFYYFKNTDDKLIKMNSKHEFHQTRSLNEILATHITNEDMDNFWKKYIKSLLKEIEVKADSYELTEEDHKAFNDNGIIVKPVYGATGYTKQSSAIHYDGVQYCIRLYGRNYEEKSQYIAQQLNHFDQIKERHHPLIKSVYDHLIKILNTNDVFVILEGGLKVQASFNYSGGHLANLVLDMDTKESNINKNQTLFNMTVKKSNRLFETFKNDKINIVYI